MRYFVTYAKLRCHENSFEEFIKCCETSLGLHMKVINLAWYCAQIEYILESEKETDLTHVAFDIWWVTKKDTLRVAACSNAR